MRLAGRRTLPIHSLVALLGIALIASPALAREDPDRSAKAATEAEEAAADAEPEEPAEPPLVVEGRELFEKFEEGDAKLAALKKEARRTKGEPLEVLNRQIAELRVELLKDISKLVDNVIAQENAEIEAPELRDRVERLLDRLVPSIVAHINSASKRTRRLRQRRETAEQIDLLEIEQDISAEAEWTVTLFRSYADTIDDMVALGMNADPEREDLEEMVTEGSESVARRLQYQVERRAQLQSLLVERPEDEDLKLQLAAIEARRERTLGTLGAAIRLLERLDLPAAEYQQLVISATGEVTADIFKKDVALGLVENWIQWVQDWFYDNGPNYGFKALMFVVILSLFRVIAWIARALLMRTLASERVDASQLLQNMASSIVGSLIMVLGALFALSQIGVELAPVLAGLGIAGFIVGFALQDSLGNLASGVMILAVRPYDVGDMIEAAGVFGKVSNMSLIATTILTIDNQTLVVPNSRIWGDVIKNVTHQQERRVDMTYRIAYSEDLDRVEAIVREILDADARVLADPEPILKLHKLNEWSVDFVVRPWVKTDDYWDVYWDVTREVKRRFEEKGIHIPMPHAEVQLVGGAEQEPS